MMRGFQAIACTYERLRPQVVSSFPSITYRGQNLGQIMAHVLDQCADRQVYAYGNDRVGHHDFVYTIRAKKEGMKVLCEGQFTQIGSEMGFVRKDNNLVNIGRKIPHTPFYRTVFQEEGESAYNAFPGAPVDTYREPDCIEPPDLDSRVMGLFDAAIEMIKNEGK